MAANRGGAHVWFITGSSSEFGRELAGLVLRRGGRAILAAPDASALVDLVASYPTAARALPLDADDDAQIADAVAIADGAFGGIDVLVNIAEGSTNSVAVTKAVLPGMCERGAGHVVNIGLAEGFGDALAAELAMLGVKISSVEPNVEAVIRLVEAPVPSLNVANGGVDPERLRRILGRLSPEADDAPSPAPVANDTDPAEQARLRRAGRAAE
jgi:short chain dehydrogenase